MWHCHNAVLVATYSLMRFDVGLHLWLPSSPLITHTHTWSHHKHTHIIETTDVLLPSGVMVRFKIIAWGSAHISFFVRSRSFTEWHKIGYARDSLALYQVIKCVGPEVFSLASAAGCKFNNSQFEVLDVSEDLVAFSLLSVRKAEPVQRVGCLGRSVCLERTDSSALGRNDA